MSRSRAPFAFLVGLALAVLPAIAQASAVAVTPLIPERGVKDKLIEDLFSLMSSELEFMQGVTEVIEVTPAPPALTARCLDSMTCLAAIAREARADQLLTGAVASRGDTLEVDLLFFDVAAGKTVRRRVHTLPGETSLLVDELPDVLRFTVTGEDPDAPEDPMAGVSFGADDDDDAFSFGTPVTAAPPEPEVRTVVRDVRPPPEPEPEPEPEDDDFDPAAFDFGSSPEDISFETTPEDVATEDEADAEPPPSSAGQLRRRDVVIAPYEPEFEEDPYEDDAIVDLDRGAAGTRSQTTKDPDDKHRWRRVHIPIRGGYANYSVFHFGAVGAEVQVRTFKGLFVTVGLDVLIVSRCVAIPQGFEAPRSPQCAVVDADGNIDDRFTQRTDAFFPVNLGLLYRFKEGKFQPYVGVDGNLAPLGRDAETNSIVFTGGARARVGMDYFFTRGFGINIDAALGFWTSPNWPQYDERVPTIGFQPNLRAGVVVAF